MDSNIQPISYPMSPVNNTNSNLSLVGIDNLSSPPPEEFVNKFTTESTQSYSYTPISNNSLTMRLNVLKRSLEILLENPNWLNSSLESFPDYNINLDKKTTTTPSTNTNNNSLDKFIQDPNKLKDLLKLEKSVSSSTLQTLIQSSISNDTTEDDNNGNIYNNLNRTSSESSGCSTNTMTLNDSILDNLHEMLNLLHDFENQRFEDMNKDTHDKFLNLHKLSLSNAKMETLLSSEDKKKYEILRIKLLHALATPFIEQNSSQSVAGIPILKTEPSTFGLSTLNMEPQNAASLATPTRQVFHASSNAKTKSPKAVFTVSTQSPWDLLNANDLGLLMFGLSRSSLNKMKLMDLISPRSRDLVINRLHRDKPLVFSGEIIAVKRNNKSLAWTSVWAKRRENLIILIFEQVVCETIDMIIQRDNSLTSDFYIKEILKQNKSLYNTYLQNFKLADILPSLNATLRNTELNSFNDSDITSIQDSNIINNIRYFTLFNEKKNYVPCAITSEYLDIEDDDNVTKSLIRINLHSLPYTAGSFVISSKNYQIKSFNEAIAKNLFGTSDLINQSINIILPTFTNLMELALNENPNISYQEGLVLPEHYFRKLSCWSKASTDNERDLLFLNCSGIEAKHNDGNLIKVDVQLHVSSNNAYVLWITFSRSFANHIHKFNHLDDEENQANPTPSSPSSPKVYLNNTTRIDDAHDTFHLNDDTTDSNKLPSQLKLLTHNDNDDPSDTDSQSSSNMSRSHSFKTLTHSSPSSPNIDRVNSLKKINGSTNPTNSEDDKNDKTKIFGMSKPLTCKEHLEKEESVLKYLRENSPHFPRTIGAEKRTKKFSDFKILKNLGQGAYGKVVFAQYRNDTLYKDCVKAIFKERILVDTWVRDRTLGTVPSEIQILYALNKLPHANIMRIVDFFEDENCYYLETLQHGSQRFGAVDLYDIIEVKKDMTEYEAKYIYFQVAAAITHMHRHGIVHRDIKDENIIVDKEYFVKLIDFGSAAWVKDGPFGVFVGTIDYAAPEVLNGQPYEGKAQDVWAMGVLLYTLLFKENPFCSVDEILDGEVKFPQFTDLSVQGLELIKKILVTDVNKRPTMQEIMDDPWLAGFT